MMRVFGIIAVLIISFAFAKKQNEPYIDQNSAQEIFTLINKVRANPEQYYQQFKLHNKLAITRTPLVWNDILAEAAEDKAMDMANRNYFAHVDPDGYGMNYFINDYGYTLHPTFLKSKKDNHFESLCAGQPGAYKTVEALIIDKGVPGKAHRNHLLGIGTHFKNLVDIGIGYVQAKNTGNTYQSYVCILIAKHDPY
jgi:uncharacterized protein YkwD